MSARPLPTWGYVVGFLAQEAPAQVPIGILPGLALRVSHQRLALHIPLGKRAMWTRAAPKGLSLTETTEEGRPILVIEATGQSHVELFYSLISSSGVERLQMAAEVVAAIATCAGDWHRLLGGEGALSREEAIGLYGELWTLLHLLPHYGANALGMWQGPAGGAHDFVGRECDLEVKTTTSTTRVHTIHGLGQLTARPDAPLYLVSLQIAPNKEGISLIQLMQEVKQRLGDFPGQADLFNQTLSRRGANIDVDDPQANIGFSLWSAPQVIRVSRSFPALTGATLSAVLPETAALISNVVYDIAVDGLGEPWPHDDDLGALIKSTTP